MPREMRVMVKERKKKVRSRSLINKNNIIFEGPKALTNKIVNPTIWYIP